MTKIQNPILKIAKYVLTDEVRQKSFIIIFALCALFAFLVRGCYQGHYEVNGQLLDGKNIIEIISKITFHMIAAGAMFIAALLSMGVLRRDRDSGMQAAILSKPVTRRQYISGKILGLWTLSFLFMFVLHTVLFIITSVNMGMIMPQYLAASLLCSFNLLFVIIAVCLLSLLMPDIAAFLSVIGIGLAGFAADGIHAVSHGPMGQMMMQQGANPKTDVSVWDVVYYGWPKLPGLQRLASSMIGSEGFSGIGSLYPLINIFLYCLILGWLLYWRFNREDII
jgi:ABC-type transport system involved in multi-copper enzyme maturation permease subunit